MSSIVPIQFTTAIAPAQDIATFSTSGSSSVGFLDEAMSSLLAEDTQRKNRVTTSVKAMEGNSDPLLAFEAQIAAEEFNVSRSLGASVLGKFKATFEKVVLNSQ